MSGFNRNKSIHWLCRRVIHVFCFFLGPGPVDSPFVQSLNPRSAVVTWGPPLQSNGIIVNYTLYLCINSATVTDTTLISDLTSVTPSNSLKPHQFPVTDTNFHLGDNLNPKLTTPDLNNSNISVTSHNPFTPSLGPSSSLSIENVESNMSQGPILVHHNPSTSSFMYSSNSLNATLLPFMTSATVPGNTTSYTFVGLLPYTTYSLQVLNLFHKRVLDCVPTNAHCVNVTVL